MAVDLDRADPWLQVGDEYFVNPRRSPAGNFVVAARDRGYANGEEVPGACVLLTGGALGVHYSSDKRSAAGTIRMCPTAGWSS